MKILSHLIAVRPLKGAHKVVERHARAGRLFIPEIDDIRRAILNMAEVID